MNFSHFAFLLLLITSLLTGCNKIENRPTQTLARVNAEDITVYQLNDELNLANVKGEQQELISKQMLEMLIDRQLLKEEAIRTKINRTPEVVQAIERAKSKILEDAYLASISKKAAQATPLEVKTYFDQHPEYFKLRKQFVLKQLILSSDEYRSEVMNAIATFHTLDEAAIWLNKHQVPYTQSQLLSRTTDLPDEIAINFKDVEKGNIFIVKEGNSVFINALSKARNSPVSFKTAAPQISQFLNQQLIKEAIAAEIARLRSISNIKYLNASTNSTQPSSPGNNIDAATHQ